MWHKHALYFLIGLFAIALSGCFEVIEEITLNEDGSGSFEYTFNFSQSKTKLNQVMLLDSINGYAVPSKNDITVMLDRAVDVARKSEGISNVSKAENFDDFIFTIKCDFTAISALNTFANNLKQLDDTNGQYAQDELHYNYDAINKVYSRNGKYSIRKEFAGLKKADKEIFEGATFISIFRSASEIALVGNKKSRISPSGKAVMLRMEIMDFVIDEENFGNEIYLKK